jgi:hypothetical protein
MGCTLLPQKFLYQMKKIYRVCIQFLVDLCCVSVSVYHDLPMSCLLLSCCVGEKGVGVLSFGELSFGDLS